MACRHTGDRALVDPRLSIVLGTLNRRALLEKCITSILDKTRTPLKIYVADAGSTDGTIEYLKSIESDVVIAILEGRKLGQARAYNDVFRRIDTPYSCWMSDDTVIVNNGLDIAVETLDADPGIGMVALKIKDVQGPFVDAPYIGGVSQTGVLNVNQGVFRTAILRDVGYFSETFGTYGIDPDLTAKVLFTGHDVVYTLSVAIHHYRDWSTDRSSPEYQALRDHHRKFMELYTAKYGGYGRLDLYWHAKRAVWWLIRKALGHRYSIHSTRQVLGHNARDWNNILAGRHISLLDGWRHRGKPYHLRQHCNRLVQTRRVLSDENLLAVLARHERETKREPSAARITGTN